MPNTEHEATDDFVPT